MTKNNQIQTILMLTFYLEMMINQRIHSLMMTLVTLRIPKMMFPRNQTISLMK
jgi:hypothetical protein